MTLNHNFGCFSGVGSGIAGNVLRLCAGGDLVVQMLNLLPKSIRITDVEFSTSAPLAQNRC